MENVGIKTNRVRGRSRCKLRLCQVLSLQTDRSEYKLLASFGDVSTYPFIKKT